MEIFMAKVKIVKAAGKIAETVSLLSFFMILPNVNKTLTFTWYNVRVNGGVKYVSDIDCRR